MSGFVHMTRRSNMREVVPGSWEVKRLGEVASVAVSNVDKHSVPGETPVKLCNYVDVYKNDVVTNDILFMDATATAEQISRFGLLPGDTAFTKDSETADDIGVPAFIEASDLVCGYHLAIARPKARVAYPKYLFYVLKSQWAADQWSVVASGVTRVGLRSFDIPKLVVLMPPLPDQRVIADHLDHATARIDELVAEQEALATSLMERRRVAITRSVLAGASGKLPLKRLVTVTDCKHLTAEFVDDGLPLASIGQVGERFVDLTSAQRTTADFFESLREGARAPKSGDLVMTRNATVGAVAIVPESIEAFALGQDVCLISPSTEVETRFVYYALKSGLVADQVAAMGVGTTFKRINVETIRNLLIPVHDLANQRRIADELDEQTGRIDRLVAECRELITLLKERRSALITAAVTGQIDVRAS